MENLTYKNPYIALRYKDFRKYIFGNFILTAALLIQEVVIGYEIYKITHDPLSLGLIGLAEALPYISIALFGGHYADRKDKKKIMKNSLLIIATGSIILTWVTMPATRAQISESWMLIIVYLVLILIGFAKGFFGPASSSLKAFLVPKEIYGNASTWNSSFWQTGAIVGPGIAGFLYYYFTLTGTLAIVVALLAIVYLQISGIKTIPDLQLFEEGKDDLWTSLKKGIKYVFNTKIILYSISLDLFSVLFGGVVAILPIFAEDILKVGAQGLGILRAAPSVGALITMFIMIYFPPLKNAWRNLLIAIAGFGIATLVFGISTHFWTSVLALFFTGAFDSVSVIIRQSILQIMTPNEMRGRVYAVNGIFVSSSNEIGAFESGVAAKIFGTVPSVIIGGSVTMIIVAWVWIKSKELFKIKLE